MTFDLDRFQKLVAQINADDAAGRLARRMAELDRALAREPPPPPPPFRTADGRTLWEHEGRWYDADDPMEADLVFDGKDGRPVDDAGVPLEGRFAAPEDELELLRRAGLYRRGRP